MNNYIYMECAMKKYYSVIIKGRTLESRNIRELLARAVNEKRKKDQTIPLESCTSIHMVSRTPEFFQTSRC
jgi:hypothetical protein